ncbi:MAG: GntR family transcriptional regulator [Sneathiella sp.]|nr:GntR family transcriptional regulator [Sneathiella sp.]
MYEGLEERAIDLGKTASSSDVIYNALRDEIISGHLKAGDSIRQEYIAKVFNVSRIPVREALKRLEAQGLVQNERYKGAVVSSLSNAEIEEIFAIRAYLEPLVIKRSVENIKPQTLADARRYCEEFSDEEDAGKWGEWNRLFHETLYQDANYPFHLKTIREAIDRVDSYIRAQLVLTHGMTRARKEHLEILEACEQGDGDRAAEMIRQHIQGAYASLMEYLKENKDS